MKQYEEVSLSLVRFSEVDVISTSENGNAGTDTPLQPIDPSENY